MSYKESLIKKLKHRPYVSYSELNELIPRQVISPEEIEEVLQLLEENKIRIIRDKELPFPFRKNSLTPPPIMDFLDTPDKFYFFELKKTLKRNTEKEKVLLDKLNRIKKDISRIIIDSDFFCYYLLRRLVRSRPNPAFLAHEKEDLKISVRRFRELFQDYATLLRKKGSEGRQKLIEYLLTLRFKFTFILQAIAELRNTHQASLSMRSSAGTFEKLELFQKKQKIKISDSGVLLESIDEHLGKYSLVKNEFILAFTPVVLSSARHYFNDTVNISDLIQEGNLALVEAVDIYDPDFHTKNFYQFSTELIKKKIKQLIRTSRMVKGSKGMEEDRKAFLKTVEKLKEQLQTPPSMKQIKEVLKWDEGKLVQTINYLKTVESLEKPDAFEDTTLKEAIEDEKYKRPEDVAIENILKEKTMELIEHLKGQEQAVIKMRFGFNPDKKIYSHKEIADLLNLPMDVVVNIEDHALKKLRVLFETNHMEGFL